MAVKIKRGFKNALCFLLKTKKAKLILKQLLKERVYSWASLRKTLKQLKKWATLIFCISILKESNSIKFLKSYETVLFLRLKKISNKNLWSSLLFNTYEMGKQTGTFFIDVLGWRLRCQTQGLLSNKTLFCFLIACFKSVASVL